MEGREGGRGEEGREGRRDTNLCNHYHLPINPAPLSSPGLPKDPGLTGIGLPGNQLSLAGRKTSRGAHNCNSLQM